MSNTEGQKNRERVGTGTGIERGVVDGVWDGDWENREGQDQPRTPFGTDTIPGTRTTGIDTGTRV